MDTKAFFHSKTLWASLATVVTGIGLLMTGEKNIEEVAIMILGAVFAVLRVWTDKPIGKVF